MSDAGVGQVVVVVVLGGGGRRDHMIFKSVQQILPAVLLVAVLHDGPQRLRPGHLGKCMVTWQIILQSA